MKIVTDLFVVSTLILVNLGWTAAAAAQEATKMAFVISSAGFSDNQEIPKRFTGEGNDVSPALQWSGAPNGTKELALICDDPDAPTAEPWVHWVIYKIPATTSQLPEGVPATAEVDNPKGAVQGKNSGGKIGYRGPMPPPGHGWHRYFFKIYALDANIALPPGATKGQVLDAMKGHVLGEAQVMGKYKR